MSELRVLAIVGCLVLLGCGSGDDAPPATPVGVQLPRVGTLGRAPAGPGTIVVDVDADGRISVGEKGPLSLIGLRDELRRRTEDPRWREPDRSSLKILLVNADASLPWPVAQWVMMVAAEPRVALYRVFFGARARGTGDVGALGWQLPKDRSCGSTLVHSGLPPRLRVKLTTHDGAASEPEDILAPLHAVAGERPVRDVVVELNVLRNPHRHVPTGFVVRVAAVALGAGVRRLKFEGASSPFPSEGADDVEALLAHVAELKAKMGTPKIRVGKETLGALPASVAVPPARGRLEDLYGAGVEKREPRPARGETEVREGVDEPFVVEPSLAEDVDVGPPLSEPSPLFVWQPGGGVFPTRDQAGEPRAEPVEAALTWLAAHQSPNGGWEAAGFGRWCQGKEVEGRDRPVGWGSALHDAGVTGLAVSAFLGAGYTNRGRHPFARTVSKGLRYLKNVQDAEGCFGRRVPGRFVYDHAAAALAMVEAYGMTRSPIYRGSAQKALDFILLCRNPGGVWRYGVKPGDNDTSVTAWMALPLVAAHWVNADAKSKERKAPLRVEQEAFDAILRWLARVTDPETGRTGYDVVGSRPDRPADLLELFPPEQSESTTAAAVLLRALLLQGPQWGEAMHDGMALLEAAPPLLDLTAGAVDHVYWYFGALATHQVGGASSKAWSAALNEAVLGSQRTDTEPCRYLGSWDPIGPWGREGGRVAATALMALTLEANYRYPHGYGVR